MEQKDRHRANLRQVVQYCLNKTDCRRTQVLLYFGEAFTKEQCAKTCDNCEINVCAEVRDVSDRAKEVVALVQKVEKERTTMLHCVDVYRGSRAKKVLCTQLIWGLVAGSRTDEEGRRAFF
jgi:superfamily II DNA helicase RecQ